MDLAVKQQESFTDLYERLMSCRRGQSSFEDTLARMLVSWSHGEGDMPDWLGLDELQFHCMMQYCFPRFNAHEFVNPGKPLDVSRMDEVDDLRRLLDQNRTGRFDSERWMLDLVIAGCLGNDHLWQDLGLWQRADLSQLMLENFFPLAIKNDKDMKWKKFLYKQLCEAEGIYTCRSPSCEVCTDYDVCFGPED